MMINKCSACEYESGGFINDDGKWEKVGDAEFIEIEGNFTHTEDDEIEKIFLLMCPKCNNIFGTKWW